MFNRKVTYSRKPSHAARAAHAKGAKQFSKYDTSAIAPKYSKTSRIVGIVAAVVVLLALIFGLVNCMGSCDKNENMAPDGLEVRLDIPDGSSTSDIADMLYDAGIIESKNAFNNEVSSKGYSSSLKSGIYIFVGGTSLEEVVEHLNEGPGASDNTFVIAEGYTLERCADAVAEAYVGEISAEDFMEVATNASQFESEFPFVKGAYNNSLEGFMFPKTYEVMSGYTAEDVVKQMLTQYQAEIKQLNYNYPHDEGLSNYQVLILASIIEKEAASDNMATVASVFYNRLSIDMPLQSDATTAYAIGSDPTPEDLKQDGPFNTYLNKGLPAGPICSPGLQALEAACNPENTDYYYFYFKDNGEGGLDYFFSKTYEEHQAAINS